MSEFKVFGDAVRRRFEEMSTGELYEVDATDLWASYLAAFPEGSNPIFRERTEHDCSCCKQFVRGVGNVVGLHESGAYTTVWDNVEDFPYPYGEVAAQMRSIVRQLPIKGVFRTKMPTYGAEVTHERTATEMGSSLSYSWHHFSAKIDRRHLTPDPEAVAGKLNTGAQVMERSLRELSIDALTTVRDLIKDDGLYRGSEHASAVNQFLALAVQYAELPDARSKVAFAWKHAPAHGSGFRNTVIGTLVSDISSGVDLEAAVRMFESKVAPQNYKRPKALVTQKMVDEATETLQSLGLMSAIERRHAQLSDVSVTDVIWVDGSVKPAMKGGLDALLAGAVKTQSATHSKAERVITIDELTLLSKSLTSMDVILEPQHQRNLVSLTAPADPIYLASDRLFRWPGDLGWSYNGDVTDSVRERVKRAGGNVDAPLRVSLSWYNTDDLDLHVVGPEGHVYFSNKAGILDVDMNVSGAVRDAVENLSWKSPRDGHYKIVVHNYNRRERIDVGFALEFHHPDGTQTFSHPQELAPGGNSLTGGQTCLEFRLDRGRVTNLTVSPTLTEGVGRGSEFWGIKTGVKVPVKTLMLSPNHAEAEVGSKHWFFALEGCLNPEPVRGIYNEFLKPELLVHKRVFELLGAKAKAPFSPDQISGVGFTLGRDDSVSVDLKGEGVSGPFKVTF